MINITREKTVPASLETQEIKDYLTEVQVYMADPKNVPKPKKPGSYRNSDLLEAFDRCFYSKCYLTEKGFFNSYAMDVEHFIPQNENPNLVYEWTNLYPADHDANMSKPRKTPKGGYLDPCSETEDVEKEILYSLSAMGANPRFQAISTQNQKAINTAVLLDRLHNGHDTNSKIKTANLRHAIGKKYDHILNKIIEWQAANGQLKHQKEQELRDLLSKKASYTMLCRSIPAVVQYIPSEFLD